MFYDRGSSRRRFLFSVQSLYEQCAFCTAPTVLLSFYENKQRVLDCRHLLCAFIVLSLMLSLSVVLSLPQPGKPAEWVELQSGSVSGRFRFEVGKAKSQSQPNLFLQEDSEGQDGWETSICSATPSPQWSPTVVPPHPSCSLVVYIRLYSPLSKSPLYINFSSDVPTPKPPSIN